MQKSWLCALPAFAQHHIPVELKAPKHLDCLSRLPAVGMRVASAVDYPVHAPDNGGLERVANELVLVVDERMAGAKRTRRVCCCRHKRRRRGHVELGGVRLRKSSALEDDSIFRQCARLVKADDVSPPGHWDPEGLCARDGNFWVSQCLYEGMRSRWCGWGKLKSLSVSKKSQREKRS